MRVLALSDVHFALEELEMLAEKAGNCDLCLLAGDLADYGCMEDGKAAVAALPKPCYAVPGNMDSSDVLKAIEKAGISVHGKVKRFQGFKIAGFGGGYFGSPGGLNFSEEEIWKKISLLGIDENTLMLSHIPPAESRLDFANSGMHIGGKSIRRAVEEFQPLLLVSGHCHESFGKEEIGKTLCVNPGSVRDGRAAVVELPSKRIEFLEL